MLRKKEESEEKEPALDPPAAPTEPPSPPPPPPPTKKPAKKRQKKEPTKKEQTKEPKKDSPPPDAPKDPPTTKVRRPVVKRPKTGPAKHASPDKSADPPADPVLPTVHATGHDPTRPDLHGCDEYTALVERYESIRKAALQEEIREAELAAAAAAEEAAEEDKGGRAAPTTGAESERKRRREAEELVRTDTLSEHISAVVHLLSRVPQDLQGAPGERTRDQVRRSVTVLSRDYEETFLEEPGRGERACVNSFHGGCFANRLRSNGITGANFALKEFYLPDEWERITAGKETLPSTQRYCLLCLRERICADFFSVRCDHQQVPGLTTFSSIANIVGPGEYDAEAVVVSGTSRYEGLVEPVVVPRVADYQVFRNKGSKLQVRQLMPRPGPQDAGPFFFF